MNIPSAQNGSAFPSKDAERPVWQTGLVSVLAAALVGFLFYYLLPAAELEWPGNLMSGMNIIFLSVLLIAGYAYLEFLKYSHKHPQDFLLFLSLAGPCIIFSAILGHEVGVNPHPTPLIAALTLLPMGLMLWKKVPELYARYPYIRAISIYTGMVMLYFFFYHNNFAASQTATAASQGLDGNQSQHSILFFDGIYQFFICCAGVYIVGQARDFMKLFGRFNTCLSIFAIASSVIPLFFFLTAQRFGIYLEGLFRFSGIYYHPNLNALYLDFISLYLLGIALYYRTWTKRSFLLPGLGSFFALVGSLFSMSKTSLFSYAVLLVALLFAYMLLNNISLKRLIGFVLTFAFACFLLSIIVNALTDGMLLTTLLSRFEDNGSLEWRLKLWGEIMDGFDVRTLLFGNGLGTAVPKVIGMRFHVAGDMPDANALNMHNTVLQNVYELGLLGLSSLVGIGFAILDPLRLVKNHDARNKKELYFLISLQAIITLFYLAYLLVNFNSYIYASIYWLITSVLYAVIIKRFWALHHATPLEGYHE